MSDDDSGTEAMPEYTIVFDGFRAYGVEVRDFGSFRSVRRFQTKSATLAWIVEQQARDPDESGKQFSGRGYTDWASVPPRRVTALPWFRAGKIMGCGQYTGMRWTGDTA
jgi:hypothetical protein